MRLSDEVIDEAMEVAVHASYCGTGIISAAIESQKSAEVGLCISPEGLQQIQLHVYNEMLLFFRSRTPSYSIIGNVAGCASTVELSDRPTWVVDPVGCVSSGLNSTSNFCLSIALLVEKDVVLSVVNVPRTGEMYAAVKGRGAFCNGQRIFVSSCSSLSEALIVFPQYVDRKEGALQCLLQIQHELAVICRSRIVVSHGSPMVDLCIVAAGKADAVFVAYVSLSDFAAGVLILTEAGGVVHHVDDVHTFDWDKRALCGGNQEAITGEIIPILKKYNFLENY